MSQIKRCDICGVTDLEDNTISCYNGVYSPVTGRCLIFPKSNALGQKPEVTICLSCETKVQAFFIERALEKGSIVSKDMYNWYQDHMSSIKEEAEDVQQDVQPSSGESCSEGLCEVDGQSGEEGKEKVDDQAVDQ